jgi:hypothetical protein
MYMPFLVSRKKYISDKVGGGGITVVIGIVQDTMITDGVIIVVILLGIKEFLMIGEIVIATICGAVVLGILVTFLRMILIGIGVVVIGVLIVDGDLLLGSLEGSLANILAESLVRSPAGSLEVGILRVDILEVGTMVILGSSGKVGD